MMTHRSDLQVLFPTNFSDSCFRASHSLAQLADSYEVNLTLAHVVPPGGATAQMRKELSSFLPEADSFGSCRRVLVESTDPAMAIANLEDDREYDLLLAPGAGRMGLWRTFEASFRADLLQRCQTPLWTAGFSQLQNPAKGTLRTVACVVNFDEKNDRYLPDAVALAQQGGARVRIMAVLRPMDEGMLAHSLLVNGPLLPQAAMERIREGFAGRACPEIDVAVGNEASELPRMLAAAEADLVFVGQSQAVTRGLWGARMAPWLDKLPCPAICVGQHGLRQSPGQGVIRAKAA